MKRFLKLFKKKPKQPKTEQNPSDEKPKISAIEKTDKSEESHTEINVKTINASPTHSTRGVNNTLESTNTTTSVTTTMAPSDSGIVSTPVPSIKNGKHLICDDSDSNRMVLFKYLTRKGYSIDEASNGLDAIEKISKNGEYHIVWMDIMMPRMNGMDCTEELRKKLNYGGVIIGLTGFIDQESVNECLKRGMNHVIGKPIDKTVLYHYAEKYTTVTTNTITDTTTST